jgi:hypothetical protein
MHGVRDFCPAFASFVRAGYTNRSCHITATLTPQCGSRVDGVSTTKQKHAKFVILLYKLADKNQLPTMEPRSKGQKSMGKNQKDKNQKDKNKRTKING